MLHRVFNLSSPVFSPEIHDLHSPYQQPFEISAHSGKYRRAVRGFQRTPPFALSESAVAFIRNSITPLLS